jgi:rRNA maturation protein Nop10
LYKNIYSKNSDIQIKKIQEYVYIIRECDFVRLNENIYKIGRTAKANPEDRFQKYRSKANYEAKRIMKQSEL